LASQAGSHQFHWPSSDTSAGTSRARTIVASMRMPTPSAVASTLMSVPGAEASAMNARNRISAAQVTSRPVRPRPSTTAIRVEPLLSYSSRIRARMNTS
jgi:hypothetical protein